MIHNSIECPICGGAEFTALVSETLFDVRIVSSEDDVEWIWKQEVLGDNNDIALQCTSCSQVKSVTPEQLGLVCGEDVHGFFPSD